MQNRKSNGHKKRGYREMIAKAAILKTGLLHHGLEEINVSQAMLTKVLPSVKGTPIKTNFNQPDVIGIVLSAEIINNQIIAVCHLEIPKPDHSYIVELRFLNQDLELLEIVLTPLQKTEANTLH